MAIIRSLRDLEREDEDDRELRGIMVGFSYRYAALDAGLDANLSALYLLT